MFGRKTPRWLSELTVGGIIAAIFIVDLVTDWAVAVAVLYVIPVLLSLRLLPASRVRWLSAGCVVLTLLGSPLARFGSPEAGAVNVVISVTAIVTAAYLGLRTLALEAASHEARTQLIRLSRIGNLGALTASIAHEVNQPLAAVSSSAGAGRRWLDADPPEIDRARESFERIAREATHAAEVVAGVRRLASRRPPLLEIAPVELLVREAVAVAAAAIGERQIELRMAIARDVAMVRVDRVQAQQILCNLLLNAIESLADVVHGARDLIVTARNEAGFVALIVEDTGPGVPAEAREHLWEPFWTGRQGGVGLGLTISRTIAEAHGGTLVYRPRAGGGAAFEMRLPAAPPARQE